MQIRRKAGRRAATVFCAMATLLLSAACSGGKPAGADCELTAGTLGFGFDDPCQTQCLTHRPVICPDERVVRMSVCAGREGCDPGTCPNGQICYSFEDPFETENFCIPDAICGTAPASASAALAWEQAARERAEATREKFARRKDSRTAKPPSPAAPPVAAPPQRPAASVLVQGWGEDLALVACVGAAGVAAGADCAKYLPAGTEVEFASWRRRLGAPKRLDCMALDTQVPGIAGELLDQASASSGELWDWVPAPPPAWQPASLSPLAPPLDEIVRISLGKAPADLRLDLTVAIDLDGDPFEEKVVRAFYPSDDPEKRGYASLWLVDDGEVAPLPTQGMELNGILDVKGVVPLDSGGALLVFTSEWMGGSGVHVVGPVNGGIGPVGEVACGS